MSETSFGADVPVPRGVNPLVRARRVGGWCFVVGALELAIRGVEVVGSSAALLGAATRPSDFAALGEAVVVPADILAEIPALVAQAAPFEIARGLLFGALAAWLLVLGYRLRTLAAGSLENLRRYVRAELAAIALGLVVDVAFSVPSQIRALRHVADKLGGADEAQELFRALPVMLSTAACASAALLAIWPLLLSAWLRRVRAEVRAADQPLASG